MHVLFLMDDLKAFSISNFNDFEILNYFFFGPYDFFTLNFPMF